MEWMYYLLEANLYLLLFYGFYKLFLQHETFYNINRYYLLLSSLTAFVLPVLQLGFLKPAPIVDDTLFPPPVLYTVEELSSMTANAIVEPTSYTDYLYPIYLLVAFGFAIKLIFSLTKIIRLWAKANKKATGKITIIELNGQTTAFSFFNLLFIHPHLAEKETVLNHELVHIKHKHSLDILLFEILQIICWFNPIIYFIKKDIKLLHEYIADDLSTTNGMQKHEYAMFLIENSFGVMPTPLTNQIFNQSILKRRINMLNKKRTANWARLRLLLALPLAGGMLCISTMAFTKSYGYVDLLPEKSNAAVAIEQEALDIKKTYFPAHEYDEKDNYVSLEKRLIVINGNHILDNDKYYGTSEADEIVYLNSAAAIKKYGVTKGKYGAVEIIGEKAINTYPPPIVRQDNQKSAFKNDRIGTTHFFTTPGTDIYGNPSKLETRYVVINGKKIDDFSNFYGVTKASKVVLLNSADAVEKYGSAAKLGAIEIIGNDLKYVTTLVDGPPPPPEHQVKFPPPVVRKDKTKFYPMRSVDKKGNVNSIDLRTIVINGKKVEDLGTFYGVTNATNVVNVDATAAVKKYGKNAKYGAVEITGNNLKYVKSIADGPPPPIMEQVKFPPPIVKPTQQKLKDPPPIEEPPAGYKEKKSLLNKTPNLNPAKPNVTKVVQGFPLKNNNDKLKEVTVVGYGTQSNPTKVVQGFPINNDGDQIKDVKIQAYPQSNPTKVVQGYPLNNDQTSLQSPSTSSNNQNFFYPRSELKHNGTQYIIAKPDLRYIEINGKPVVDKYKFFGVRNTESVKIINQQDAAKMYGNIAKYGAVIIKGADLKYFDIAPGPPPAYTNITLNRNDSFFLKIPNSEGDGKTLTIFNDKQEIVYNNANYQDDWNGKSGNYKKYANATIPKGKYTFLMKMHNDPKGNKRGNISIQ